MDDWRHANPTPPRRPSSDEPKGRNSGLLRWLVVGAAVPAASCQQTGMLDPQGPIGAAQLLLLINSTAIMLVVVVPVILATLGFAWWYRASNPREPNGFSMNRAAIDARRIRMRSKTRSYRAAWRFIRQCEPVHTSRPTGHIMLAKVGED